MLSFLVSTQSKGDAIALDIYVNQLTIKSIAVQKLQPKNKNYSFHRGWGLVHFFLSFVSQSGFCIDTACLR
jgi:hypothetical protein